jgi:hypothetical protein
VALWGGGFCALILRISASWCVDMVDLLGFSGVRDMRYRVADKI